MAHISIVNLSVDFAIFGANSRSIKKQLLSQATGGRLMSGTNDAVVVRALDGVSMEIREGDRVGLMGHNGSGKSTLLRVLAGIYHPTGGTVRIRGQVGALIDPTAGLEGDASGRENIYLRGRVLGMSDRQILDQVDEIVEFTGLEGFIDLPLRTYSAGMAARLAFAVSTAMAPDILLIDEGIGAGDANFRQKVQARVSQLVSRSRIMILAAHDPTLISRLCTRTITLSHGRIEASATIPQPPVPAAQPPAPATPVAATPAR